MADDKVYTKEGIVAQALIAYGQGMGKTRISHTAALKIRAFLEERFDASRQELLDNWEVQAVQVLERVSVMGERTKHRFGALDGADIAVDEATVAEVSLSFSNDSQTDYC